MRLKLIAPLVLLLAATGFAATTTNSETTATSPSGKIKLTVTTTNGVVTWKATFDTKPFLLDSPLGVTIADTPLGAMTVVKSTTATKREEVKTAWGKTACYDNHYNELVLTLAETAGQKRTLRVVARVYDSGVAIRYEFPADGQWPKTIKLANDTTTFRFPAGTTGWSYNGERDPAGPYPINTIKSARAPMTLRLKGGLHAAILEAAIFKTSPIALKRTAADTLLTVGGGGTLAPGDTTSWRVLLAAPNPGELLISPMPFCLNPPCAIKDTSWLKPGLAMWDWRAWGAKMSTGGKYGLDMASWRRFIDFASKHNVKYLVLDANWYGHEFDKKSNPMTSRDYILEQRGKGRKDYMAKVVAPKDWKDPIDIPALIKYGKQRNVGIILYINDIARLNWNFEKTIKTYHAWGAAGIKYGFMRRRGSQKVLDTRTIVAMCAKYKLTCNFHDNPIPPSGDRRTYPNYFSREFCHSQSDAKRAFGPAGFCKTVFVSMLAGPLDMCNGLYTLKNPAPDRPRIFTNVEATVVAETARVLITFSGMSLLPDCPEAYEKKADLFAFLSALPGTWDETKILHGRIGEYITTARRNGKQWFIASCTNEKARTLKIKLDFLEAGQTYTAKLYEDAPDADYKTNREAYRIRTITIKRGDTIDAAMANGGGHCIHITPKK